MSTEDTPEYGTWPRPRKLRRIALVVFIWAWAIAWSVGLAIFLVGGK